ncbi:glucosidase [Aureimonas endophytica]|uniref:Glucosidase n=1 Tax=Aureimonas endophytica TaxID=2027858 RepID=A0A917E0X6_9HYPH|nr:glucosidase [Aureimonas endophytica]GGD89753.1 glucosidase [Aureimonas endophytica]
MDGRTEAPHLFETAEGRRIVEAAAGGWRQWGPYLSERQWGTVREDYSADGDAWRYFPHEHARSRAYRWGEDGIAGFSDEKQRWCLALALWNESDPILKERMFGLGNEEGNHGEDVKELWWYLDAVPSHAYLRMLYKYPQAAFPYAELIAENARRRGQNLPEYELADTGVFAERRYFDVTVEYAKAAADSILMRVTVENRGPDAAPLCILPHFWARNTWDWKDGNPRAEIVPDRPNTVVGRKGQRPALRFSALQEARFLFCENETNRTLLFGEAPSDRLPKDAIGDWVTAGGNGPAAETGSKCAAYSRHVLASGEKLVLRYRLAPESCADMGVATFDNVFRLRRDEADEFYRALQWDMADPDARLVQRQALASLIWSKQFYNFNVHRWLDGDPAQPKPPESRKAGRNADWDHLDNSDVILMPDKWEYPWYASWDLAFHAVTMALIDPDFAKSQLLLLGREWYMHPNGQLPAYEWSFGDANPPVQAWAALRVYRMDAALTGRFDRAFLERVFHKLMLNFTWWVNRKDVDGRNLFQGGFLGLDNIGPFNRSAPLPMGGYIDQSDGSAWMAMYALNLMHIALLLAEADAVYEDIASKFFEHFLGIASAMAKTGGTGLWDEQDQFFYDVLELTDGSKEFLRVRSLVGLIPLCAVEVLTSDVRQRFPGFAARMRWMLEHRPDLTSEVSDVDRPGEGGRLLLALLRNHRMRALLARMLDETEFLSDYGLRSVSKAHAADPFRFRSGDEVFSVDYEPGESTTTMFGGNSNWRGPIWMPVNALLIEALHTFEDFYGPDYKVECPAGSGRQLSLSEAAHEIARRLTTIFLRDGQGRRAVLGAQTLASADPHFADLMPFHEYFHGETGAGLGAAHQTGWTALVALFLQPRREIPGGLFPAAPCAGARPKADA